MLNRQVTISPVTLPNQMPEVIPKNKFWIGQHVKWSCVPAGDFGQIVGLVFASEASVRAIGFHYAIALDPSSPSYNDGILTDWGFESDLELLVLNQSDNGSEELH